MQSKIGFIGAGNMATALVKGLLADGVPARQLAAFDPSADQIQRLKDAVGKENGGHLTLSADGRDAGDCDLVVLAVKPQILPLVAAQIASSLKPEALVISIAAGISLHKLRQCLPRNPLMRCMPNTPALVGLGASGLYAPADIPPALRQLAKQVFASVGLVHWVDKESDLDLVTALSGSGPAYFFLLMESMIKAATDMGMDAKTARELCVETCRGAGMLATTENDIGELRRRVTSPGGTTEQAISTFQAGGFENLVADAMKACEFRAREMAQQADSEQDN